MTAYKGDRTTGFASPAAGECDGPLDLSAVLDLARPQRYPMRVTGQSLESRGISPANVPNAVMSSGARPILRFTPICHVVVSQILQERVPAVEPY